VEEKDWHTAWLELLVDKPKALIPNSPLEMFNMISLQVRNCCTEPVTTPPSAVNGFNSV